MYMRRWFLRRAHRGTKRALLSSDADIYHCYIEQINHVPLDSEGYQELNIHLDGIEVSRSILVSIGAHRTISNRRIA
jgi:hypothetical protein